MPTAHSRHACDQQRRPRVQTLCRCPAARAQQRSCALEAAVLPAPSIRGRPAKHPCAPLIRVARALALYRRLGGGLASGPRPFCALRGRCSGSAPLARRLAAGGACRSASRPPGAACAPLPAPGRWPLWASPRFPVPRLPSALVSVARPRGFVTPGWGRGLSPFGALLRFGGALLPPVSSPPPPRE